MKNKINRIILMVILFLIFCSIKIYAAGISVDANSIEIGQYESYRIIVKVNCNWNASSGTGVNCVCSDNENITVTKVGWVNSLGTRR